MPEFDELRLQVSLVDNASPQLRAIKAALDELGGGSGGGGQAQNVERFKRHTGEIDQALRNLIEVVNKGPRALSDLGQGVNVAGFSLSTFSLAAFLAINRMNEFTKSLLEVLHVSRRTGFDPGTVQQIKNAYEGVGLSAGQATRELDAFAEALADLPREHSKVRAILKTPFALDKDMSDKIENMFIMIEKAPTTVDKLNTTKDKIREIFEFYSGQGRMGESKARFFRERAHEAFGIPGTFQILEQIKPMSDAAKALLLEQTAQAERYSIITNQIAVNWQRIAVHLTAAFAENTGMMKSIHWIDEFLEKWLQRITAWRAKSGEAQKPQGPNLAEQLSHFEQQGAGGGVAPPSGGAPSGGGVAPSGGGVAPSGGGVAPSGGGVAPSGGGPAAPSGPAAAPGGGQPAAATRETSDQAINRAIQGFPAESRATVGQYLNRLTPEEKEAVTSGRVSVDDMIKQKVPAMMQGPAGRIVGTYPGGSEALGRALRPQQLPSAGAPAGGAPAATPTPSKVVPGKKTSGDPRGLEPFIRAEAQRHGIDPDVAMRVARSEGLTDPVGDRGTSFGAFQLHTPGGLGDEFRRQTGLDPADPKNEQATISWSLNKARETGWGPWHGAKRVGIEPREGIGPRPAVEPGQIEPKPAVGPDQRTGQVEPVPGAPVAPGAVLPPSGREPSAFILHHTGGRGTPASVVSDWAKHRPGVGTQYIMDREGIVHDVKAEFGYGGTGHIHPKHMAPWAREAGISSRTAPGMEIIARSDRDITEEQIRSAKEFIRTNYPQTPIYGHGEVNPGHREADEAISAVNAIRAERAGGLLRPTGLRAAPGGVPYGEQTSRMFGQYPDMDEMTRRGLTKFGQLSSRPRGGQFDDPGAMTLGSLDEARSKIDAINSPRRVEGTGDINIKVGGPTTSARSRLILRNIPSERFVQGERAEAGPPAPPAATGGEGEGGGKSGGDFAGVP